MMRSRFVATACALAALSACTDPAPDPARLETPRSVYTAPKLSPDTMTTPIEVVPDSPLACDAASGATIAATVYWNARQPKVASVEIHVRSRDEDPASAKLWTRAADHGIRRAPAWARLDTVFELRDTDTQAVIGRASAQCD